MKKAISIILVVAVAFSVLAITGCADGGGTPAAPAATPPAATPAPATPTEPAPEPGADGLVTGRYSGLTWNPDNIGEHTLLMAHAHSATSMTGTQYNEFAVAVEELSGGRMRVDQRIGGTLIGNAESLDAAMTGTVDLIHGMSALATGTIPDLSPLTIAGAYAGDDWHGFIDDTRDVLTEIYTEFGLMYMGALPQGNSAFISPESQIRHPSDIHGLAMRASGTWISRTFEAWGGAATTVGIADLQDALARGIVQGTQTGLHLIVPNQLYEVARYVTFTTMSETFAALLMNMNRFQSFNADEQALLLEAGRVFERRGYEVAQEFIEYNTSVILNSGRNETHTLTPAEEEVFQDIAFSMFYEMEPYLGPRGMMLADALRGLRR